MRVPAALLAFAISGVAASAAAAPVQSSDTPAARPASNCPRVTSYHATGDYRGQKLVPKKLTELPPAATYMAVYRHIGTCEAPLTMAEYRNPRRR